MPSEREMRRRKEQRERSARFRKDYYDRKKTGGRTTEVDTSRADWNKKQEAKRADEKDPPDRVDPDSRQMSALRKRAQKLEGYKPGMTEKEVQMLVDTSIEGFPEALEDVKRGGKAVGRFAKRVGRKLKRATVGKDTKDMTKSELRSEMERMQSHLDMAEKRGGSSYARSRRPGGDTRGRKRSRLRDAEKELEGRGRDSKRLEELRGKRYFGGRRSTDQPTPATSPPPKAAAPKEAAPAGGGGGMFGRGQQTTGPTPQSQFDTTSRVSIRDDSSQGLFPKAPMDPNAGPGPGFLGPNNDPRNQQPRAEPSVPQSMFQQSSPEFHQTLREKGGAPAGFQPSGPAAPAGQYQQHGPATPAGLQQQGPVTPHDYQRPMFDTPGFKRSLKEIPSSVEAQLAAGGPLAKGVGLGAKALGQVGVRGAPLEMWAAQGAADLGRAAGGLGQRIGSTQVGGLPLEAWGGQAAQAAGRLGQRIGSTEVRGLPLEQWAGQGYNALRGMAGLR